MNTDEAKKFLKSLEGEWSTASEGPVGMAGTTKNVAVGEYALALDSIANVQGAEIHGHLLLNLDEAGGEFHAVGVNSRINSMTQMRGKLGAANIMVLEYEGRAPGESADTKVPYRDVTTVESKDRYTVMSCAKGKADDWVPFLRITNDRIK